MYRQSPKRHQKSKGFRLKHVLQICVLVAVCFWLIYQVKHSHDKRKQFDENDAKSSRDVEMHNAVLKLGRKDLNPQEKGPNKDLESHDEETEEEIVEEDKNEEVNGEQDKNEEENGEEIDLEDKHEEQSEEEDKHEEETGEEDKNDEETGEDKHEETGEEDKNEEETGEDKHEEEETREEDKHEEETGQEDKLEEENGVEDKHEIEEQEEDTETEKKGEEGTGGGDDGVNEQEQEKTESGNNQEEEFVEEKKDKEDTDEKENEDKDDDNKDSRQKNDSSIEDHDHDEGSKNTREAREEQYKGDDASSAVTHDGQITRTENVIGNMENQASTEEHKNKHNNAEVGNAGQNTIDVNVHEVEAAENGNLTSSEEKSSNGQSEMINNTDPQDSSIKNETQIIMSDMSHSHSVTDGNVTAAEGVNVETLALEQPDNSTGALENTKLDSNSSSATATKNVEENPEESRDSSTNSEFVSSENLAQSNVLAENKDGFGSTTTVKSTDEVGNETPENVEGTEGTYENSDSSTAKDTDEVQHDSIDSSDSSVPVDDKENHVDLDTLPDIRTEGSNSEEVAEE